MIAQVFCQFNHKQGWPPVCWAKFSIKRLSTPGSRSAGTPSRNDYRAPLCGIEINDAGRDILSELITGKIRLVCALPDCEGGDKEDFLATGLVDIRRNNCKEASSQLCRSSITMIMGVCSSTRSIMAMY